ncbi:hypothetical protein KP509_22G028500 [Ceratopteris richardii]|uniref:Beta-lactamase-related domain-containing protein n=1 Tax=Ceratopteris richardii TaxID=49495 RepID=A0A8T2S6D8_CERRI|nr:hypothetical protein KP509_22G028500 [Ceratopteris richardii]
MCKCDEVLRELAEVIPDSSPGTKQVYHALTYGWLCGGIVEKASRERFQVVLNEVLCGSSMSWKSLELLKYLSEKMNKPQAC